MRNQHKPILDVLEHVLSKELRKKITFKKQDITLLNLRCLEGQSLSNRWSANASVVNGSARLGYEIYLARLGSAQLQVVFFCSARLGSASAIADLAD